MCPYLVCFRSSSDVIISLFLSSRVCLIVYDYPLYISPVFWVWFRLVYSLLPDVSCLSAFSCPALMSWLKTIIWVYVLVCVSLFLPRVCTLTEDQTTTVSGAPSPRFVLFVFWKVLFCSWVLFCLSRGKEVAARHPALARVKWAWEFGGIAASAASPLAASPPIAGDHAAVRGSHPARRSRDFTPLSAAHRARRSREITPLFAGKANPPTVSPSDPPPAVAIPSPPAGSLVPGLPLPQARRSREITPPACLWLNARRPASDSMPAGPPLTQCPPARLWLNARRIAADSSPPDRRWLMPAGCHYP